MDGPAEIATEINPHIKIANNNYHHLPFPEATALAMTTSDLELLDSQHSPSASSPSTTPTPQQATVVRIGEFEVTLTLTSATSFVVKAVHPAAGPPVVHTVSVPTIPQHTGATKRQQEPSRSSPVTPRRDVPGATSTTPIGTPTSAPTLTPTSTSTVTSALSSSTTSSSACVWELCSVGINSLPIELLQYIFSYVSMRTLAQLNRVCSLWRIATTDEGFWRSIFQQHLGCGEPSIYDLSWKERNMYVYNKIHNIYGTHDLAEKLNWAVLQGYTKFFEQVMTIESDDSLRDDAAAGHTLCLAADEGHLSMVQMLLDHGVDIDSKNVYSDTALHTACLCGRQKVAEYLLDKGLDVNVCDADNYTPLMSASKCGHLRLARVLVSRGADVNAKAKFGDTALILAAEYGHDQVVRYLLELGAEPNSENSAGNSAIIFAAENGHHHVVQLLLETKALVNETNEQEWSALHYACDGGFINVVRMLLAHGANVDRRNDNRDTPLILAALQGHKEVVQLLLEHNASTTIPSQEGVNPLHAACMNGFSATAKVLLDHDRELQKKSMKLDSGLLNSQSEPSMFTPLMYAVDGGHIHVVKLLLEEGADVGRADAASNQAIHLALTTRPPSLILDLLIQYGADVNSQNLEGETALLLAAQAGELEAVQTLLRHVTTMTPDSTVQTTSLSSPSLLSLSPRKQQYQQQQQQQHQQQQQQHHQQQHVSIATTTINCPRNSGETPLCVAARGKHLAVMEALIEAGADLNSWYEPGLTPLMCAVLSSSVDPVRLLLKYHQSSNNDTDTDNTQQRHNYVDANLASTSGETALHYACSLGEVEIVQLLLDTYRPHSHPHPHSRSSYTQRPHCMQQDEVLPPFSGLAIDAQSAEGDTSLMRALSFVEIVRLLLNHGADPRVRSTGTGETALERAENIGLSSELVELLRSHHHQHPAAAAAVAAGTYSNAFS
eukprot:TRINITY_DN1795_c0_g1_i1.p1 TRINITY_DN1795_c0_g1~~TRINITY_DN1795_c0_g1_i1.p1  ORF type:complete len:950 (-),score=192.96 TRINITY_DN1795_c0_g1_i1:151-3000(-)